MSHDQRFKNLILDYPRAALEFLAEGEAADLATGRIVPVRQEQLKARLSDRFRELDIPLMVEWPGQERAALLFVVEHQTQGRAFNVHRLAHYCLDLSELLGLARVVPVVLFVDDGARAQALSLAGDGAST